MINQQTSRKIIFYLISFVLIINLFFGYRVYSSAKNDIPEEDGYSYIYRLMPVINTVRKNYVDADKVSYKNIVKGALKGILRELDPFCSYMEPQTVKNMVEENEGKEFGGVGMIVSYKDGTLVVIAPLDDSPAFKAGIKPGDIILEIDGKQTSNMNLDECVKMLKGEPGTKVELEILREDMEQSFSLTLVRENIELSTVKAAKIIEDGIAYLRITQFTIPTAAKLDEELLKLKEKGMNAIIIDLRGNPGGLLNSAIEVCSRFIETGKLVVSTVGRNQEYEKKYYALNCKKYLDSGDNNFPMVILVDQNSASASEIFAGCMKDYKRAVLIGTKTFGKGSVQTIIPLPDDDGGAIRLTTAKYFTPNKLQIHEHGIEPDISVPLSRKQMEQIYNQRLAYPGIVKPEGHNTTTDIQLERAIEIIKGIKIYETAQK
ncbi:MAG TPA: S41 family peptidase [Victivallales bacterium]|nr:S41 family peptidase [Victivallales bacterium]HRU01512.1 S41 family peptidase [Victivallales bacterium]